MNGMMMLRQGDLASAARIKALEDRVVLLENMVKALQSEQRPKMGRPPKVRDERETTFNN